MQERKKKSIFSPHFLFAILKALSDKVNRLVRRDWVFLEAGLVGVEGQEFGLVCQAVLKEKKCKKSHI